MRKFAVVGSGPAGFYTAQRLLKIPNIAVTMFEKRMVPFGLLRFGVAPDHPEVKNAASKFEKIAASERFQFVGNCEVGKDVSVRDIQSCFDGVVLSSGSQSDRSLGINHEFDTKNVFSAREFVGWYNGDPDMNNIAPKLSNAENAVVIGNGNVALDCARILLSPISRLSKTDITSKAIDELRKSKIKNVYVIGRRGVLQANFSSKELREMMNLPDVSFRSDEYLSTTISNSRSVLVKNRPLKRICEILTKGMSMSKNFKKSWHLKFLNSPVELVRNGEDIKALLLRKNELKEVEGVTKIIHTNTYELIGCDLLIKSIGYRNVPFSGVPFDEKKNVIPNERGRVLDENRNVIIGLYTSGWLKTGPVGVLTSTLFDSNETATSIEEDLSMYYANPEKRGLEGLNLGLLNTTTFDDWHKIDAEEIKLGSLKGKPREKITDLEYMKKFIS